MSSGEETQEFTQDVPEEIARIIREQEFHLLNHFFSQGVKTDLNSASLNFAICLKELVDRGFYEVVLDLVANNSDLFEGQWPSPIILQKYFSAVHQNDLEDLECLILHFGCYPKILSKQGHNLFEEAVHSNSLQMLKFVKETIGVVSKDEKTLLEAGSLGHKGILQYLYEEIGVEVRDSARLLKNVIEAGSLECLQYIRCYMGIGSISDESVIEFALFQAVQMHRLDLLDYLITYFNVEFDPARIQPTKKIVGNRKNICLYLSFHTAVVHNELDFLLHVIHAVKVRLGTKKNKSKLTTYLELLNMTVKKNNFNMMKLLIKHGKMWPSACLEDNPDDDVILEIEKASLRKKEKIRMLRFLKKYDFREEYELAIQRVLGC
jgi:hypothetical protein